MNVLYVTAFKNIGRQNWSSFQRPNEIYYNEFFRLYAYCPNLIAFVDEGTKQFIKDTEAFDMNRIYDYDEKETFFKDCLHVEETIMNTDEYKKLVEHRLHHPEHFCAAYNIVNHNKVVFLQRAKQMYPDYDYYIWVDFHYTVNNDSGNQFPKHIAHLPRDKVSICSYMECDHIPFLSCKEIACAGLDIIYGAVIVVPAELIEDLYEEYEYQLQENYRNHCVDDDQGIHLSIFLRIPHFYHLIPITHWGQAIGKMLL
jgi:hypothetical protein